MHSGASFEGTDLTIPIRQYDNCWAACRCRVVVSQVALQLGCAVRICQLAGRYSARIKAELELRPRCRLVRDLLRHRAWCARCHHQQCYQQYRHLVLCVVESRWLASCQVYAAETLSMPICQHAHSNVTRCGVCRLGLLTCLFQTVKYAQERERRKDRQKGKEAGTET